MKRSQDYAWADAGSKVKVYIDVELPANASEETVHGVATKETHLPVGDFFMFFLFGILYIPVQYSDFTDCK